jgi:hypothetical protein
LEPICIYSRSVIIICSSFSSVSVSSFVLIGSEEGILLLPSAVLFFSPLPLSLSLPAENTSYFCIYIYISIRKCANARARRFFFALFGFPVLAKFRLGIALLRTRIEHAYRRTQKESSAAYTYIYASIVRFHPQLGIVSSSVDMRARALLRSIGK